MYKKKSIVMIAMCVAVLFMAIVYATFSSNLRINGSVGISGKWLVHFTSIVTQSNTTGASNNSEPTASGTTAVMDANLDLPGDSITYTLVLKNDGNVDAIIDEVSAVAEGSNAIIFSIDGINQGDQLKIGESKTITVKIEYDINFTSQPEETSKVLTVDISCIQDMGDGNNQTTAEDTYITGPVKLSSILLKNNPAQADTNIDFSKINSDTNGNGLYYTSTNTENNKVTYYFRGQVNNYVKLGDMYFRVIRINEDGSIRVIYTGKSATASGSAASIGKGGFNLKVGDNAFAGYMYGTPTVFIDTSSGVHELSYNYSSHTTGTTMKMATSYSFDSSTGEYTLLNPVDGSYTSTYYNYYTCMSATDTTCTHLAKLITATTENNTNKITSAEFLAGQYSTSYYEATRNTTSSNIKTLVDNWYKTNMLKYSTLISDSGFCNDRTVTSGTGYGVSDTEYASYTRIYTNKQPQFGCPNEVRDLFTTSTSDKGNKALTYPVGLITADEVAYAGNVFETTNSNNYLNINGHFWTMSPYRFFTWYSNIRTWRVINGAGLNGNDSQLQYLIRPVINLNPDTIVTSGNGTSAKPYMIKVS